MMKRPDYYSIEHIAEGMEEVSASLIALAITSKDATVAIQENLEAWRQLEIAEMRRLQALSNDSVGLAIWYFRLRSHGIPMLDALEQCERRVNEAS